MNDAIGICLLILLVFIVFVCVVREDKRMKAEHKEIMEYYRVATKLFKRLYEKSEEK